MTLLGLEEMVQPYVESVRRSLLTQDEINTLVEANDQKLTDLSSSADIIWILIAGFLVFLMQVGFAMLEAGTVRSKNAINILFKNVMDVSIAGLIYFAFGYGFAYGTNNMLDGDGAGDQTTYKFIGTGSWFLTPVDDFNEGPRGDQHTWFFQFAFAATAATIVSGAVAERTKLDAYFAYSLLITVWVYPVISHWIWATGGWLSAFQDQPNGYTPLFFDSNSRSCGMLDYAGSGVVHMTGGYAALVGAYTVGPRTGRYKKNADGSLGEALPLPGHNIVLSVLGTMILWFGWYGFNCGSTLALDGPIASKVAVTTTLAPAMACLTGTFVNRFFISKTWDLAIACNCVLAGLVSITAPCSICEDWHALFIGMIGALVYLSVSWLLLNKLKIDDPLDAFAVHGACGTWGCLSVGIFASEYAVSQAYSCINDPLGNTSALQFGIQLIGVLSIIAWVVTWSILIFTIINKTMGMRVSEELELEGLDISEHGGKAYELNDDAAKTTTLTESV